MRRKGELSPTMVDREWPYQVPVHYSLNVGSMAADRLSGALGGCPRHYACAGSTMKTTSSTASPRSKRQFGWRRVVNHQFSMPKRKSHGQGSCGGWRSRLRRMTILRIAPL
jgi:hypothetical protein